MRKFIFAASAAIVAFSVPALAQGQGQGQAQGRGQGNAPVLDRAIPGPNADSRAAGQVQADIRAGTDARANVRAQERTGASVDRAPDIDDVDDDALRDDRDRNVAPIDDDDGDDADRATPRYGGDVCPPGLSARDPACVPPGQANRTFTLGERLPDNWRYYTDLDDIPDEFHDEIADQYRTDAYRYVYQADSIYVVNRSDSTVAAILDLDDD